MTEYILQERLRADEEAEYTPAILTPRGLIRARAEMSLKKQDVTDPNTRVVCGIEYSKDDGKSWIFLGSSELIGHPDNDPDQMPYIEFSEKIMKMLDGFLVRAFVKSVTRANVGMKAIME